MTRKSVTLGRRSVAKVQLPLAAALHTSRRGCVGYHVSTEFPRFNLLRYMQDIDSYDSFHGHPFLSIEAYILG